VSRRHARVVVASEDAAVEDLGSKNGTIVEEKPASGLVPPADGEPDSCRHGAAHLPGRRGSVDPDAHGIVNSTPFSKNNDGRKNELVTTSLLYRAIAPDWF
jgi:pSer/pThr/pTyr-binding forkhead associated (FHA) protein